MTRSTVTLLFTDLVSSTELASRLGPGPAEALRKEHFTLLRDAATQAGGREVKNLGDGLMLAFASPTAAVDAAVAAQQAIDARNRRSPQPFEVRMGAAIGEVTEEDGDYFGEAVVQAARLCARAGGGQILVTEFVRALAASSAHAFTPVGGLELKGLPDPVPAHEVAWNPTTGAALPLPPRLRGASESPYVGRAGEQAQLDAAWEAALGAAAQLVLLGGEPGIGKTRLSTHHAMAVHESGGTVLYGAVDEGVGIPYQPWVEALDHYVAHAPQRLLDHYVDDSGGDLVRLLPKLTRRVADLPAPSSSDGETERYLLFEAITRLLATAAADNPVLVVLDDLHWADTPTLHLLAHLHRSLADSRVLFVVSYRDSELTPGHPLTDALATLRRNDDRVTRIALSGLVERDLVELLAHTSGQLTDDARALARTLERDTNGNPLFVAEVLRDLLEGGYFEVDDDGRWQLSRGVEQLPAPQGVREVVAQRVGRLGADAARVLATAAVIGREFELALLAAVLEVEPDDLLEQLDAAIIASLLTESGARAGSLRFVHALIAQALVDGLTSLRRRQLHRRVASTIELLHGLDLGERIGAVARHLLAAGEDPEKTVDYARRAGRHAITALAPDEAVRWFRIALDLLDEAGSDAQHVRCELMIDLGEALRDAGDPSARDQLVAASRLARQIGAADLMAGAVLALNRSFAVSLSERDDEVVEAIEAALEAHPERDGVRARLLAMLAAEVMVYEPLERRQGLIDEALEIARELDDVTLAQVMVSGIGALWASSTMARRRAMVEELSGLAPASTDPHVRVYTAIYGIWTSLESCDRPRLEHWLAEARAASASAQPASRWTVHMAESTVALVSGDLPGAQRHGEAALALATESGIRDGFSGYAALVGDQHIAQGRFGELAELLEERWKASPELIVMRAALAWALVARGDLAAGTEHMDAVLAELDDVPESIQWTVLLTMLTRTASRTRRADAAAVLSAKLATCPDGLVVTGGSCGTHVCTELGMLSATMRRRDDAVAYFEHAASRLAAIEAPLMQARNEYEHARALHELGDEADRGRARELVERSLAAYRRVDFSARIAQCEELLAQLG